MEVLVASLVIFLGRFASSSRIVGGENATLGQFPYQLGLSKYGYQICGASLVVFPRTNRQFAVCAAHCFYYWNDLLPPDRFKLFGGTINRTDPAQVVQVTKIAIHYTYDRKTVGVGDIAVVFFDPPFELNESVQPIELDSDGNYSGDLIVSGWGTTEYGGESSDILQYAQVPIVPYTTCQCVYAELGAVIYPSMNICAGGEEKDSCQGDSGGPAVGYKQTNEPLLIGIVSWGYECAVPEFPGIYTSVSYYYRWIIFQALISTKGK